MSQPTVCSPDMCSQAWWMLTAIMRGCSNSYGIMQLCGNPWPTEQLSHSCGLLTAKGSSPERAPREPVILLCLIRKDTATPDSA